MSSVSSWQRYWRFNFVGAMGFVLQLSVLAIAVRVFHLPYLLATLIAVEAAILHNFVWHERYTWLDRASQTFAMRLRRLAFFHAANGLVSLIGNFVLMWILVGACGWNVLLSNAVSVLVCSVINFYLGDVAVFREAGAE